MKKKDGMPAFVYIGLLGINSRVLAWFFFYLCIAISVGSGLYGLIDYRFFLGLYFLPAAGSYYYCIKWVDNNSNWN